MCLYKYLISMCEFSFFRTIRENSCFAGIKSICLGPGMGLNLHESETRDRLNKNIYIYKIK